MKLQNFSPKARIKSFRYALQGIVYMLKTQANAWLHAVASICVLAVAWYLQVTSSDWRWLTVSMAMVWAAEALNTALEYVCDAVSPHYSLAVQHAKDIAAGCVLICAISAAAIGAVTFWPYLMRYLAGN